ncbi:MAG TPA: YgiQ family radical SAM protein, partial [Desulfomonilia bacterium]|nr:YgiQ family radical SAM protein [Desulfomonilia bacterium]
RSGTGFEDMRGICYISGYKPKGYLELPSFEDVSTDTALFIDMFRTFHQNNDPVTGKGLYQRHGNRHLVHNPPWPILTAHELDAVYELDYEHETHPHERARGEVKAIETIRFSLRTHRGCMGQCNFCSISMHEGAYVVSRSEASILSEAERLTSHPSFKGYLQDVGGPTANMYGFSCTMNKHTGLCRQKRCLFPHICPQLDVDHERQISLLRKLRSLPGVKKAFVTSGIRHDLVCADRQNGDAYLREITAHHVSGQMKLAPEHADRQVLDRMGKTGIETLLSFRDRFLSHSREKNKKQFLTYYFLAAHPGCTENDMKRLRAFINRHLKMTPEQVQIFTPTPSTYSTLMYYTGIDPFTGGKIFVERDPVRKKGQKDIITGQKR